MTVEQYIKFVLRFLKENKVYDAFLYNAKEYLPMKYRGGKNLDINSNNYIESFSQHLKKYDSMTCFIDYAFCWEYTREGHDFWEDIHIKFEKAYEKEMCK